MSEKWDIEKLGEPNEFRPGYFYNKYGDLIHVRWQNGGTRTEHLNTKIALQHHRKTNEVIGVTLYGAQREVGLPQWVKDLEVAARVAVDILRGAMASQSVVIELCKCTDRSDDGVLRWLSKVDDMHDKLEDALKTIPAEAEEEKC